MTEDFPIDVGIEGFDIHPEAWADPHRWWSAGRQHFCPVVDNVYLVRIAAGETTIIQQDQTGASMHFQDKPYGMWLRRLVFGRGLTPG